MLLDSSVRIVTFPEQSWDKSLGMGLGAYLDVCRQSGTFRKTKGGMAVAKGNEILVKAFGPPNFIITPNSVFLDL